VATKQTITEDELLKNIKALEADTKGKEGTKTEDLSKSADTEDAELKAIGDQIKELEAEIEQLEDGKGGEGFEQHLRENGTEEMGKALDVSSILSEMAKSLGQYAEDLVEPALEAVKLAEARDTAVLSVLQGMKKSIDTLTETVAKWGKTPLLKSAAAGGITVLEKNAAGGGKQEEELSPKDTRKIMLKGLEILAKSAERGSPAMQKAVAAASVIESNGTIDQDLALLALKKGKEALSSVI
jgi:hypothetical protein